MPWLALVPRAKATQSPRGENIGNRFVIPPEATGPVLIIVGYFMMTLVRDIEWGDPAVGIPALLTMVVMPFTFSITNGVGAGFLAFTVISLARGRWRDVHWLMYLVSAVFVWYFVRGVI